MARSESTGKYVETHGASRTDEYRIWGNMLYRCRNSSSRLWQNYGGRGIKVCPEWDSFDCFIRDLGFRPSRCHSLERINVDGDYCKSNCVWATPKDQARNRRNSRMIEYMGKKINIEEFCDITGFSRAAVRSRFKRGWSSDRIVNTPVRSKQC